MGGSRAVTIVGACGKKIMLIPINKGFALGQVQPSRPIDPLLKAGLDTAGVLLARSDPGAPETFNLIERIIIAPPLFPGKGGGVAISRLSDVNPYLRVTATALEHPILVVLGVLSVPVIAYMLGKKSSARG